MNGGQVVTNDGNVTIRIPESPAWAHIGSCLALLTQGWAQDRRGQGWAWAQGHCQLRHSSKKTPPRETKAQYIQMCNLICFSHVF